MRTHGTKNVPNEIVKRIYYFCWVWFVTLQHCYIFNNNNRNQQQLKIPQITQFKLETGHKVSEITKCECSDEGHFS